MTNTLALRRMISGIGVFLIAISLYCSFLLYTSFSTELSDKAAWGGMGLGLDMFKNVALLAALALWALNSLPARILSVVVGFAYLLLTILSFMAFFGFMASVQHQLESVAMLNSAQYQSIRTSVDNAASRVEELSRYADSRVVAEAETKLQDIEARKQAVISAMSAHAHPDCSPKTDGRGNPYKTLAAQWCGKLQAVQAEAAPYEAVIAKHQRYQSAIAHQEEMLAKLAALDTNQVQVQDTHLHPMFVDLGKLLSAAPDEMKVAFMFISSAAAEILGTLSILISTLLARKRSFTLDEIEHISVQLHEQRARLSQALGFDILPAPAHSTSAGQVSLAHPPQPQVATPTPDYDAAAQPTIKTIAKPLERQQDELPPQEMPPRLPQTADISMAFQRPSRPLDTASSYRHKGLDSNYRDILSAILQNQCSPQIKALQRHFQLAPNQAQAYLENLTADGYLEKKGDKYLLRHSIRPADSLCHGVSYREADDLSSNAMQRNIHTFFTQAQATLPVKMRQGINSPIPWGRKAEHPGSLPFGGWASLESIHAGRWEAFQPRPIQIAATGYVQQDKDGENHYFELQETQKLQGLMAQDKEQQVVYLVTVQAPKEFQYINSRWPRVV